MGPQVHHGQEFPVLVKKMVDPGPQEGQGPPIGQAIGGVEVVVDVVEPPWFKLRVEFRTIALGSEVRCGSLRMRSSGVGLPRANQEEERMRARPPSTGSMLDLPCIVLDE